MKGRGINIDIIKANDEIKTLLLNRLKKEMLLSNKDICEDALNLNFVISGSNISNYFVHPYPSEQQLSQENILWLCTRYGIRVRIHVDIIPYNKKDNLTLLRKFWPNTPIVFNKKIIEGPRDDKNKRYEE